MHDQFCETCGMKLRSTPESKLTQCCCCMAIDAQHELHDSELTQLRAENARLKSAHSQMEQELNTLRSREMNIDDISDYTESIERLRERVNELEAEIERLKVERDRAYRTRADLLRLMIDTEKQSERLQQEQRELVEVLKKAVKMDACGCLRESYIKCSECWQIDCDINAVIAKHGEGE